MFHHDIQSIGQLLLLELMRYQRVNYYLPIPKRFHSISPIGRIHAVVGGIPCARNAELLAENSPIDILLHDNIRSRIPHQYDFS